VSLSESSEWLAGEVVRRDGVRGVVTAVGRRTLTVVWEHGGREAGAPLREECEREGVTVPITIGMLGRRGWNREQAIRAALRRIDRGGK
jgi:hypothetical protein